MERTITFRVNDDEYSAYMQAWRQLGYTSQSQFHREAGNILMCGKGANRPAVNTTILMELNTHLNRLGTTLSELLTLAANDNFPDNQHFEHALDQALSDIAVIRKKAS
jgi:hypothetical protein